MFKPQSVAHISKICKQPILIGPKDYRFFLFYLYFVRYRAHYSAYQYQFIKESYLPGSEQDCVLTPKLRWLETVSIKTSALECISEP